jgi:hypothetical protein
MANPFPFVAGSVLTAAELNGIGEATAYTPTFTNFTLGNGTVDASYVQVQKLVQVSVLMTLGSTSSMTGQITISKPVTGTSLPSNRIPFGVARLGDSGTGTVIGYVRNDTTTRVTIRPYNAASTYVTESSITASIPFPWAVNDTLDFSFVYEAA